MDSYTVEIKPSARKELEALPDNVLVRAVSRIESLAQDPRPSGCKKLKNHKDLWRIRVSDWRVLYLINDSEALVTVTRVAHRREVYDRD